MSAPRSVSMDELRNRYEVLLLDSFGVLVDGSGALPGARELVAQLADYVIVTNDASRSPATCADRFRRLGIAIDEDRIVTSGMLLAGAFAERNLAGARTLVLGTDDSRDYVRAAGGEVAPIDGASDYDAIVVADDDGYDYFAGVDAALSAIIRGCEAGRPPALLLPNPDIIYPKAEGQFGITAGGVAVAIEAGVERRLGASAPRFTPLGKPHSPMFEHARRLAGEGSLVMIGDQLETDIRGANDAGIASALLTTGVTRWDESSAVTPNYLLASLRP